MESLGDSDGFIVPSMDWKPRVHQTTASFHDTNAIDLLTLWREAPTRTSWVGTPASATGPATGRYLRRSRCVRVIRATVSMAPLSVGESLLQVRRVGVELVLDEGSGGDGRVRVGVQDVPFAANQILHHVDARYVATDQRCGADSQSLHSGIEPGRVNERRFAPLLGVCQMATIGRRAAQDDSNLAAKYEQPEGAVVRDEFLRQEPYPFVRGVELAGKLALVGDQVIVSPAASAKGL